MKHLVFALPLLFLFACGEVNTSNAKSETILQAEATHEKALAVFAETADIIHDLMHRHDERLSDAQDANEEELALLLNLGAEIDLLHDALHDWEHNLTEVPGHEHTHDHDHGHDHHHGHDHAKDRILEGLSDEEHLAIQEEQLKLIETLRVRAQKLADKL